jgi:hypothetical protein
MTVKAKGEPDRPDQEVPPRQGLTEQTVKVIDREAAG